MGDLSTHNQQICLEIHEQGHQHLVQGVSTVQQGEGDEAASRCRRPDTSVQPLVQPCSRGPCGTAANLCIRFPLSLHACGQVYTVGGSIKTMSAVDCADAFIAAWVSRFGVPANLTSERGAQFTAVVWSALCLKLGVSHQMTTAYHPQSNGIEERAHRQLKDALHSRLAGVQWPQHPPWVLLGLRAVPKEDSGISSAELAYGAPLSVPGQFITAEEPPPAGFVEKLRSAPPPPPPPPTRQPTYAEMAAKPPAALMAAKFVYVRRGGVVPPLEPLYLGPYQGLDNGPKVFRLAIGGRAESVSIDRLQPHLGTADVLPQRPPTRGRPPWRSVQSCPSGSTLAGSNVAATAAATNPGVNM
jgi:hypothetical protein